MKNSLIFIKIVCFLFVMNCFGQKNNEVIELWSSKIPNSIENLEFKEIQKIEDSIISRVEQVTNPTLTVFTPKVSNGTAVIICPGGGYHHLAINKEGNKVAEWLNKLGITAFVLKYRLPSDVIMKDKTIGPLQDAQKAVRLVRNKAENWNLNIDRIGIMGFSAGGHLAATLSTHYNKNVYDNSEISAKPNFSILIYPVISMNDTITHKGSRRNLLGNVPSKRGIEFFSNELNVNKKTSKTFLIHATDDKSVPVENSIQYYLALKANNIAVEMHVYEKGGHGFGLGKNGTSKSWSTSLKNWLKENSLID